MILMQRSKTTIKVEGRLEIKYCCPALNNSFVVIATVEGGNRAGCGEVGREQKAEIRKYVAHYNEEGHRVWEKQISRSINRFNMLSDRQIIIQNNTQKAVDLISLVSYQVRSITLPFSASGAALLRMQTFFVTNLLCVCIRHHKFRKLRIAYYNYNLVKKDPFPLAQWETTNSRCHIRKVNNCSKVAWLQPTYFYEAAIIFNYVEYNALGHIHHGSVKTINNLAKIYGTRSLTLRLHHVEEAARDRFIFHVGSSKDDEIKNEQSASEHIQSSSSGSKELEEQSEVHSSLIDQSVSEWQKVQPQTCNMERQLEFFVIDCSSGNQKAVIRHLQLLQKEQSSDISDSYTSCSDFAIEQNTYCYSSENGIQVLLASKYSSQYVTAEWDPYTIYKQQLNCISTIGVPLLGTRMMQTTRKTPSWFHPPFSFVEETRSRIRLLERMPREVVLRKKKYNCLKEAYLHWLLAINEDFDDDLLQDALSLLE